MPMHTRSSDLTPKPHKKYGRNDETQFLSSSHVIINGFLTNYDVTPITYWSGLGNRVSVRVRFYGYQSQMQDFPKGGPL